MPASLTRRSLGRSLAAIACNWLMVLAAFWLASVATHPLYYLPIIPFVAFVQMRLLNLGHHGLHWDFCENRSLNDLIGRYLLIGPMFGPYQAVRFNHFSHHNHLGTEKDHEYVSFHWRRIGKDRGDVLSFILSNFVGFGTLRSVGRYLTGKTNASKNIRADQSRGQDYAAIVVSQVMVFSLATYLSGLWYGYFLFLGTARVYPGGWTNHF